LNEKASDVAWRESIRQASDMLDSWLNIGRVLSLRNDLMKLALHVLCLVGFGQRFDYETGVTRLSNGHNMSYRDALAYIFSDIITAMMSVQLPFPMPVPRFRRMEHAKAEFKKYMVEMMDEERRLLKSQPEPRDHLISVMVRAADISKGGSIRNSLTEEEVFGNLFIWNFAGYDNTTGMLAYAITLLSVYTHTQDWIREEINAVFGDSPVQRWDYDQGFLRLKRCLAIFVRLCKLPFALR
jgi:cytochrome P450